MGDNISGRCHRFPSPRSPWSRRLGVLQKAIFKRPVTVAMGSTRSAASRLGSECTFGCVTSRQRYRRHILWVGCGAVLAIGRLVFADVDARVGKSYLGVSVACILICEGRKVSNLTPTISTPENFAKRNGSVSPPSRPPRGVGFPRLGVFPTCTLRVDLSGKLSPLCTGQGIPMCCLPETMVSLFVLAELFLFRKVPPPHLYSLCWL